LLLQHVLVHCPSEDSVLSEFFSKYTFSDIFWGNSISELRSQNSWNFQIWKLSMGLKGNWWELMVINWKFSKLKVGNLNKVGKKICFRIKNTWLHLNINNIFTGWHYMA